MKRNTAFLTIAGLITILLTACEDTYYGKKPQMVLYSHGFWKLEKIEGKTTTILAPNIGYEQIIEIGQENRRNYFNEFRDKKFVDVAYMNSAMNVEGRKGRIYMEFIAGNRLLKLELLDNYLDGKFKLISSGFINTATKVDTVKYHYSYLGQDKDW
jgi:hypothetical protein